MQNKSFLLLLFTNDDGYDDDDDGNNEVVMAKRKNMFKVVRNSFPFSTKFMKGLLDCNKLLLLLVKGNVPITF